MSVLAAHIPAQEPCSGSATGIPGKYSISVRLGLLRTRVGAMFIRTVGDSGWGAIEVNGLPPLHVVRSRIEAGRFTADAIGGGTAARLSLIFIGNVFEGDMRADGKTIPVRGRRVAPCGAPARKATAPAIDVGALRRTLTDSIPVWLARYNTPGLAVAIVDNCAPVWTGTFGFADVTSQRPVTRRTAFSMGSISKTFTAWAIMTLVQEGKLDLDAPAERYLKQWHFPSSSFDASQVTVRRLLTHTAGVNVRSVLGVSLPARLPTLLELMNGQVKGFEGQKVEITERPGSRVRYSGGGYEILQLVVEDVTGERFVDYARRRILSPLGMKSSSFAWNDSIAGRVAIPYKEDGVKAFPQLRYPAAGAAGLYSTIDDMTAFLLAHCARPREPVGAGVITSASLQRMMRFDAASVEYGLGYEIVPVGGRPLAGHSGSNPGWKANVLFVPERRFGFVVLTNIDGGRARVLVMDALSVALSR